MLFSRGSLEFSIKGNEEMLDPSRTAYPDTAYSASHEPFASITIEGTLDLTYDLSSPATITEDTYISFGCKIPQDVSRTGICLIGDGETCLWTGGDSLSVDDQLKTEYGGVASAYVTDYRIYLGDNDFDILNTNITSIKLVQEAISDNVIREKQEYGGTTFDFIQGNEKAAQVSNAGTDDSYRSTESPEQGYFACGLQVYRDESSFDPNFQYTGPFDLRVKWCNYQDWNDQRQTSSIAHEMCEEDKWIFALRAANLRDATPYGQSLIRIEFLCIGKDWKSITKKEINFPETKFSAAEQGWCKQSDNDSTSANSRVELDGYFTTDDQCLERCISESINYVNVRGCQRDSSDSKCYIYTGISVKDVGKLLNFLIIQI